MITDEDFKAPNDILSHIPDHQEFDQAEGYLSQYHVNYTTQATRVITETMYKGRKYARPDREWYEAEKENPFSGAWRWRKYATNLHIEVVIGYDVLAKPLWGKPKDDRQWQNAAEQVCKLFMERPMD